MPRLTYSLPRYRKHKSSGQAIVPLAGRDHYLGRHGSKPSRVLYDRLVCEWLAGGRQPPPSTTIRLTVEKLIARYWKHAKAFYRRADGTPTQTAENMQPVLRERRRMYGDTATDEFGPNALKAVRFKFVEVGCSRRTVTRGVKRVRLETRWLGGHQVTSEEALQRFFDRVTAAKQGEVPGELVAKPSVSRQSEIDRARHELDAAGL